jgi:hypothetical protein
VTRVALVSQADQVAALQDRLEREGGDRRHAEGRLLSASEEVETLRAQVVSQCGLGGPCLASQGEP